MWQTKYASAVPKNLGVGVNFWPCSKGYFLWVFVVRDLRHRTSLLSTQLPFRTCIITLGK